MSDGKESPGQGKSILAYAARLAERVARYGVEDKLACMQILMDARLTTGKVRTERLEHAESYANELLTTICEESSFADKVATCDLWLYYVSGKKFVCPSESFQYISAKNGDRIFAETDGATVREVYESELLKGRLQPKPLGKTNYMIANRKAIVINKRDNGCRTTFWSSSHKLEFGSFIGIPLWFFPDGKEGVCFMSALYLRCTEDLTKEESGTNVTQIVRAMENFRGKRFIPMVKIKNRPHVQELFDNDKGHWYEVQGERRISRRRSPLRKDAVS